MKKDCMFFAVLTVLLGVQWLLPSPGVLNVPQNGKLVKATVISTDDSLLQKHGLLLYGSQMLRLELTDGTKRDGCNELRAQMELDKLFRPGDKVLAVFAESGTLTVKFLQLSIIYYFFVIFLINIFALYNNCHKIPTQNDLLLLYFYCFCRYATLQFDKVYPIATTNFRFPNK